MKKRDYGWLVSAPFFLVHIGAVAGVVWLGWSWKGAAIAAAFYFIRMFGVTGAYHRYFSHKTYRTSRPFQLVLAVLAQTSLQKGALWWAAHHRDHHKYSDTKKDPHSWREEGFWWSHVGWILSRETEDTNYKNIPDLARFPELRWLNKNHLVPGVTFGVLTFLVGGWFGLVWAFAVSTSLLWHGTFSINSFSHWWGRRRYKTDDDSKNSLALALITMGEGWHNNHHYYPRSASQGFFWWEIDITFYVLRAFSAVGLIWDLHTPPQAVLDGNIEAGRRVRTGRPPSLPASEPTAEAAAE
jgi:stearoyl-CoA desaturase (delta-9 desaturase)